jgi:hypothetical protein
MAAVSRSGHPTSGTAEIHRDLDVFLTRLARARVDDRQAFEHVDLLLHHQRGALAEVQLVALSHLSLIDMFACF